MVTGRILGLNEVTVTGVEAEVVPATFEQKLPTGSTPHRPKNWSSSSVKVLPMVDVGPSIVRWHKV